MPHDKNEVTCGKILYWITQNEKKIKKNEKRTFKSVRSRHSEVSNWNHEMSHQIYYSEIAVVKNVNCKSVTLLFVA